MLRQSTRLHDSGFFESFQWPQGDVHFESITVIYGPNGSGKSTISRELLAAASSTADSPHPLRITVGNRDEPGRQSDSSDELLSRLYVFSGAFVRENHRLSDNEATVPAIVTLGKRSVENENRLADLRDEANDLRRTIASQESSLDRAEKDLTALLQSVSAEVVGVLYSFGSPYQSKSQFNRNKVAGFFAAGGDRLQALDHSAYIEAVNIATGPAPETIALTLTEVGSVAASWASEASEILSQSPATLILDTLRSTPQAESWVRDGRGFHEHSEICIFCGGDLSPSRRHEIDAHFSEGVNRVRAQAQEFAHTLESRVQEAEASVTAVESAFAPLTGSRRSEFRQAPIVVVDDPVSSLDQGVFIGVSSALWSLIARPEPVVEQLILLTHNFELFRQWDVQWDRFPADLKAKKGRPGLTFSAFELRSQMRNGKRSPRLSVWPHSATHRKKSRSAYHHAFIALAEASAKLSRDDDLDARLEAQLLFPNVIRRVLETFLAFKSPGTVGDLAKMMASAAPALQASGYRGDAHSLRHDLLRYSNVYSHGETPQTDHMIGPEEVHAAIGALFTFMHHVDEAHFAGMCDATGFSITDLVPAHGAGE